MHIVGTEFQNKKMIKLISKGKYRLVTQKDNEKTLVLGKQGYHWTVAKGIGEILTFCKSVHKEAYTMSEGSYRIYAVKNEEKLVDLLHLELSVGEDKWQGYLLLTGLSTKNKIRSRIIATKELITKK